MTEPTPAELTESEGREDPSPLKLALGFFILPLLLVIAGIAVFMVFGVLAHDGTDPADFLPEINGRGINEPWQAAFHLSQQLQHNEELRGDPDFAAQVVQALGAARDKDPRVRRFLAVALGRIGHEAAVPALIEHTTDEDAEVRVNSLWALGTIADDRAVDAVADRLSDGDVSVRTMAAYVLGAMQARAAIPQLQVALNDPVPAVSWNAAVALGMMRDASSVEVLGQMIDRDYLATVPGVEVTEYRTTMVAALSALERLGGNTHQALLIRLRDQDPDLTVREAARKVLAAPGGAATSDARTLLAEEQ